MREFKEKKVLKRIIFSWPVVVGFGFLMGYMAVSVFKVYLNVRRVALDQEAAKRETESLASKKSQLEAALKRLETPAGLEEEIRKKFQVKKPGEQSLIIVEKPKKTGPAEKSGIVGFFKKIWAFFSSRQTKSDG